VSHQVIQHIPANHYERPTCRSYLYRSDSVARYLKTNDIAIPLFVIANDAPNENV
jgi:hypothetical protein